MPTPFSPSIHKDRRPGRVLPDTLAGEILSFLASDPERLRRFFDITGLSATTLRGAAAAPGFAASLLDYIAADERCLLAFAADSGREPSDLAALNQAIAATPPGDP